MPFLLNPFGTFELDAKSRLDEDAEDVSGYLKGSNTSECSPPVLGGDESAHIFPLRIFWRRSREAERRAVRQRGERCILKVGRQVVSFWSRR